MSFLPSEIIKEEILSPFLDDVLINEFDLFAQENNVKCKHQVEVVGFIK